MAIALVVVGQPYLRKTLRFKLIEIHMFDLFKNILFIFFGLFAVTWFVSSGGGWQELAKFYRTEQSLPKTFLLTENQRITFKRENKSGVMSLNGLGIGLLDYGFYLSSASVFAPLNMLMPTLLIPWSDIAYRKIAATNFLNEYYTFYLGNPRIVRFSINADTINKLEQDYGESIFINKLGEPE